MEEVRNHRRYSLFLSVLLVVALYNLTVFIFCCICIESLVSFRDAVQKVWLILILWHLLMSQR